MHKYIGIITLAGRNIPESIGRFSAQQILTFALGKNNSGHKSEINVMYVVSTR